MSGGSRLKMPASNLKAREELIEKCMQNMPWVVISTSGGCILIIVMEIFFPAPIALKVIILLRDVLQPQKTPLDIVNPQLAQLRHCSRHHLWRVDIPLMTMTAVMMIKHTFVSLYRENKIKKYCLHFGYNHILFHQPGLTACLGGGWCLESAGSQTTAIVKYHSLEKLQ